MLSIIIGIIGGGVIGWIVAHHYFIRANTAQTKLFNKLPDELRDVILEDQREKLSVAELNEILESKTIDKNHKGRFPYKACPKCGSKKLEIGTDYEVDHNGDNFVRAPFELIQCLDCGWSKTEFEENKEKN